MIKLQSNKSLDELEQLVMHHFASFEKGQRDTFTKTPEEEDLQTLIFQESQHVYLQGLTTKTELSLLWHLPPTIGSQNTEQRVVPFIVRMLSDTGTGGMVFYLRSLQLIWGVNVQSNISRYATVIEIVFYLTGLGVGSTDEIVKATFDYIHFLQKETLGDDMRRLFEEMRILNLKDFHYGNQKMSLETTKDLAMRLQYINDHAQVLTSESWRDSRFCFKSVQGALAMLKQENLLIVETLAKGVQLEKKGKVQVAPYSGAHYVTKPRSFESNVGEAREGGVRHYDSFSNSGIVRPNFGFIAGNKFLSPDVQAVLMGRQDPAGGDSRGGITLRRPENHGTIQPQRLSCKT